jgi:NADH:ubiquinone oxidoreductase subunit F (NADH-binding)
VVVNAAEGEPASLKDRTLLQRLPHLVLDGGELAARAVGADELIVGVCDSARAAAQGVAEAIAEREGARGAWAGTHLVTVPSNYVAGQDTALLNYLNGGGATPTFTPPMPAERGVGGRPTLVSNAETFAHLALIARHGPDWFRQLGTPSQPGSTLVTLSGPVANPGVFEIEYGGSLTSLLDAAGGTTAGVRAVLIGGYGGIWIGEQYMSGVTLSDEHLATHGASLGAGVVLLLSAEACPVAETARAARWLADQSAGQCGPCVHGLAAIATTVAELAGGSGEGNASKAVARLASVVRRRGACGHPDGAVSFVLSALHAFAGEFDDHARHGPCDSCLLSGELPLPPSSGPTGRTPMALR